MSQFAYIFLFLLASFALVFVMLGIAKLLRKQKPNPEKLSSYESGEESVGIAQVPFNIKYYTISLVFLLFEVELVLLFPWARVFTNTQLIEETNGKWVWYSFTEIALFVFILALGLVYAWGQGLLNWVKPTPKSIDIESPVPSELYQKVNEKYSK